MTGFNPFFKYTKHKRILGTKHNKIIIEEFCGGDYKKNFQVWHRVSTITKKFEKNIVTEVWQETKQ